MRRKMCDAENEYEQIKSVYVLYKIAKNEIYYNYRYSHRQILLIIYEINYKLKKPKRSEDLIFDYVLSNIVGKFDNENYSKNVNME